MDDGTLQWEPAVPYLADRFTCHVMSVRNRGGSGHSEDLSPPPLVEDVAAYASSVGEPVGLVGLSIGGTWVLGAANRLVEVTGVVAYEPVVMEVISEEVWTPPAPSRQMGSNVPADLAGIQQSREYQGPSATDPLVLAKITAPVLLLRGGRSNVRSWFHAGVRHVAEHVPQATVHEFADLGHLAPMVAPEPIVDEIAPFFTEIHATARPSAGTGRQRPEVLRKAEH